MNVNLKENVQTGAPFFSLLSFWWLKDLFQAGARRTLTVNDLYEPLPEDRSEELTNRLERNWLQELNHNNGKPSLARALLKTFRKEFASAGLVTVFNDFVVRLLSPLLLQQVLSYFRRESDVTFDIACCSAVGIVLLGFCGVLSYNQITYMGCHNGGKLRTAVCGLVYLKTLRLSKASSTVYHSDDLSPGHVINLISNDLGRFDMVSVFINWIWSAPLLVLVISWILYDRVGWPPLIGVAIILIVVPVQCYLGKLASRIQLRTATETDKRLGLVAEMIAGIQMIKMYAWEKWIRGRIERVRATELRMIRNSGFIRGVYMTMNLFATRLMLCSAIFLMAVTKTTNSETGTDTPTKTLTTANVFMISAYYSVIGHSMGQMFVRGVTELAAVNVSIRRLEDYLIAQRITSEINSSTMEPLSGEMKPKIQIEEATAYWKRQLKVIDSKTMLLYKTNPPTLNNINLNCDSNKMLVGIVGPVGSGKTSLLELILGELPLEAEKGGRVSVNGRISYSPQEAWITNASIRENVTFDESWNESRYHSVLEKCALVEDFKDLPHGDSTVTGDRGSSLSGGQRARVGLARAIYRKADIYLLDDPLSAVDSHVGRKLFDEIIGRNGFLRDSMRLLVTHQLDYLKSMDWIVVMKEGSVELQGRPEEILTGDLDITCLASKPSVPRRDIVLTKANGCGDSEKDANVAKEFESVFVVPKKSVLMNCGSTNTIVICALFALTQLLCSMTDAFAAHWIRWERSSIENVNRFSESVVTITNTTTWFLWSGSSNRETFVLVSALLLLSIAFWGTVRTFIFQCNAVKTTAKIHEKMIHGILTTPIRFFETNSSGRILNKFSRDLGLTDVALPKVLLDALQIILTICGSMLIVLIVNPIFLLPLLLLAISFQIVRRIYLKTSKHLKRLDGITKSPVFTHVTSSINGLSVIRSTRAEQRMITRFHALQDINTASWFLFQSTTVAFCQLLDVLAVLFTATVLFYFLCFPLTLEEERIGLAISQAMLMSGLLSWGMRQTAAASNAIVSAERVLEYDALPKETSPVTIESPRLFDLNEWPRSGSIKFVNVNYRYEQQEVLHDINLDIGDKQKVGIVGRTGSGKSSLINAIFRMSDGVSGSIFIDGVDTREIPLELLRRKLSIIPQDPVLFRGTVLSNLDPLHEHSDDEIRLALSDVHMAHLSPNHPVHENGNNFSLGQKQLLCLARVILRSSRIIIMDEATANVDASTEELIQRTIQRRFKDCTVIIIAHRVNTARDCDVIAVMDQGTICAYGPPSEILIKVE